MKKFFAILLTVCLLASALCVSAFAADPVVIRVAGMKEDGTLILPEDYAEFDEGWNKAAKLAQDHDWMDENGILLIVVDLYADWNAASNGKFGSGSGFKNSTICVPAGTSMMINMNGHTINRGKKSSEQDGEVILIGQRANLIINGGQHGDAVVEPGRAPGTTKMGTGKGGYSSNGAGGIHMDGNGKLTLNNVHIVSNGVKGNDGAAIAAYDNSTVTMNGGSISNNHLCVRKFPFISIDCCGTLYVKNSTVTLNNVKLSDNYTDERSGASDGALLYATGSTVTMDGCLVSGNAVAGSGKADARSVITAKNSKLIIKNTDFTGNASGNVSDADDRYDPSLLFDLEDSSLTMKGGKITGNNAEELFFIDNSDADLTDVTITHNTSAVLYVNNSVKKVTLTNCILGNNTPGTALEEIRVHNKGTLIMTDCTLGDTTYGNRDNVDIIQTFLPDPSPDSATDTRADSDSDTQTDPNAKYKFWKIGSASILGEGSPAMIISLLALAVSVAAMGLTVRYGKKLTGTPSAKQEEDEE